MEAGEPGAVAMVITLLVLVLKRGTDQYVWINLCHLCVGSSGREPSPRQTAAAVLRLRGSVGASLQRESRRSERERLEGLASSSGGLRGNPFRFGAVLEADVVVDLAGGSGTGLGQKKPPVGANANLVDSLPGP